MSRSLLCALAASTTAPAADASVLRLNFAGGGQYGTIVHGDTIDVEVWFDISSDDTTMAICQFSFQSIPGDPISVAGYTVEPNALDASYGSGPIGLTTGFAAAYPGAGNALTGVGPHLLGTVTLTSSIGLHELAIDADVFIADADGNDFRLHPRYADYSGYYIYGDWGGPSVLGKTWSIYRNPLVLYVGQGPEPASLALLALGSFAAFRRRR